MSHLICREREIKLLNEVYHSSEAEFVAIYGRRRIGKTFLVRQLFDKKKHYIEIVGKKNENLKNQLSRFAQVISSAFFSEIPIAEPTSWEQAFAMLTEQIKKIPKRNKIVLFFDELPWLAGKRSKMLDEMEHYWNTYWVKLPNLKIIVCGSAASWMLDNIINARGGLHNRITQEILLKPFDLRETKAFLHSLNIKYTDKQIVALYIVMGGVAYYLKHLKKSKSLSQNIYDMCFTTDGVLYKEFDRLFVSLFENHEQHIKIIRVIANKRYGITYDNLATISGITSGGGLSRRLNELEKSGFIRKYTPYGKKNIKSVYRVVDEYTMFYLKWIETFFSQQISAPKNYWALTMKSPSYTSWSGFGFELICQKNTDKILEVLGIDNIRCQFGYWSHTALHSNDDGAQIDMLIDRDDDTITLIEIKLCSNKFSIDKTYASQLSKKIRTFVDKTKTTKRIELALITANGLKKNIWSEDLVDQVVDLSMLLR